MRISHPLKKMKPYKTLSSREKWEKTRFTLCVYALHLLSMILLSLSLFPAVFWLYSVWKWGLRLSGAVKVLCFTFAIGPAYFLFGLTLIFLAAFTQRVFRFSIKPGLYHYYRDTQTLRWMAYNSLILVVNGVFLDALRLSPFQTLFYRLMGAKIGKDVYINTSGLADLSLLEIGDNSMIGGGVALICHAAERGFLRLAPTKVGAGVSIGIGSIIMPDVEIGDGASIGPSSVVPKGSRIPPRSSWGGNPVEDLRDKRRREQKEKISSPPGRNY